MYKFKYKSSSNFYYIILCYYVEDVLTHVYSSDYDIASKLKFSYDEYQTILDEFGGIPKKGYCNDMVFYNKLEMYKCMLHLNKNYECYIHLIN